MQALLSKNNTMPCHYLLLSTAVFSSCSHVMSCSKVSLLVPTFCYPLWMVPMPMSNIMLCHTGLHMACHHVIMSLSCHAIYSVVCLLVATHGLESPCHVPVDAGPALAADWAQLWWPWRILRIASPHPAHRHHHHHSHSRCRPNFEVAFTIFREDTQKQILLKLAAYRLLRITHFRIFYKSPLKINWDACLQSHHRQAVRIG